MLWTRIEEARCRLPPEGTGRRAEAERRAREALQARSRRYFDLFAWIFARALRGDFHAVRLAKGHPVLASSGRFVVYTSHPSWWDACVYVTVLKRFFPGHIMRAPIDAAMMEKYPFMAKIGAFGVDLGSKRGALDFLAACRVLFEDRRNLLIVAAQGRFADVRERPLRLQAGIAHLPDLASDVVLVPLAIEYAFWSERKPEALLRFGAPIKGADLASLDIGARLSFLEGALETEMDALAADSQARRFEAFTTLIDGSRGINPFYDAWRRLRAFATGRSFSPEHGAPRS